MLTKQPITSDSPFNAMRQFPSSFLEGYLSVCSWPHIYKPSLQIDNFPPSQSTPFQNRIQNAPSPGFPVARLRHVTCVGQSTCQKGKRLGVGSARAPLPTGRSELQRGSSVFKIGSGRVSGIWPYRCEVLSCGDSREAPAMWPGIDSGCETLGSFCWNFLDFSTHYP